MATNSFTGTSSYLDPNRQSSLDANQRVNLGTLQDKGLASLLAQDTGAQSGNSYNKFGVASLSDLNDAAANYSKVDRSGWLDQYRTATDPYIAGLSSLNRNIGYTKRDNLDDIEGLLSTTGLPQGYTQNKLDPYRYELFDPTGKSLGEKYYGVDDALRNLYRNRLGNVSEAQYVAPPTPRYNEGWLEPGSTDMTSEQRMWADFIAKNGSAGYIPTSKLREGASSPAEGASYSPNDYITTPGQAAYRWNDSLYKTKDEANAAREAQIMSRPNQYKSLMEKYEALGEGGLDPQNWKGNYGANNVFSGPGAIAELGGQLVMNVDPRTGQWSVGGYKVDSGTLAPDPLKDYGYTPYVQQGKQKKGGLTSIISGALTGGVSYILPKQFDPSPFEGKLVTEYGGNQLWRDYGDNTDKIKALLNYTPGGSMYINESDLANIPEFWNKTKHDYNTKSEDILIPNMAALRNMTIAGTIGDIFFPEFTWGGGAAGSRSMWATANKGATGETNSDIFKTGAKNWAKGALGAYLGSVGSDLGTAAGYNIDPSLATAGGYAGSAVGSGLASGIGGAIDTGSMSGFGKNFGQGALSSLIGSGAGAAGRGLSNLTGLDPRLTGALARFGGGALNSKLRGRNMNDRAWAQLALTSALGQMRPLSSSSRYAASE